MKKIFISILITSVASFAFAEEPSSLKIVRNNDRKVVEVTTQNLAGSQISYLDLMGAGDNEICFNGSPLEANEIVQQILENAAGDASIYGSKVKISDSRIEQNISLDDESGRHSFKLDIARCK